MWLEKFILCGSSSGPTLNHQYLAERLADGDKIPLGKLLLGLAYSMMHQVSVKLLKIEPISTVGGPWWLIQLWLQLYFHKWTGKVLKDQVFPSENFTQEEEMKTRRCTSFGEAASAIAIPLDLIELFKGFYKGFEQGFNSWFIYDEEDEFEHPYEFRFSTPWTDESSSSIFQSMIKPGIVPVDFRHGRCWKNTKKPIIPPTYEFYNPSVGIWAATGQTLLC